MRSFLFFFAVISFVSAPAQAQIYLKKNNSGTAQPSAPAPIQKKAPTPHPSPAPSAEEELNDILNGGRPRTFKNSQDYANAYYDNCVQQQHPILQGEDLKLLCGCTSVQFAKNITPNQVKLMKEDSAAGQEQRNRVLMLVYAPCMQTPIRALILDECMKSTPNKFLMKDQPATCRCLADGVSKDLQKDAPRMIEQSIRTNPTALDPLAVLLNSKEFENRQKYHATTCVQKHGVGNLGGLGSFLR